MTLSVTIYLGVKMNVLLTLCFGSPQRCWVVLLHTAAHTEHAEQVEEFLFIPAADAGR